MKELVIISGKGGTGKTSLTASFAALAGNSVLADCDVDAADMHLLLNPDKLESHDFYSGNEPVLNQDECSKCGTCETVCRFGAISRNSLGDFTVDPYKCEGCGACVYMCPVKAFEFPERKCGKWYVSQTRFGKMVHAALDAGGENSGKLVSQVRQAAKKIVESENADLLIVDGPPGIGCPVIASIGGVDAVLIVTEPTLSGMHDMERVLRLTNHFKVPAYLCVNKSDINVGLTRQIHEIAEKSGAEHIGDIPYDPVFTKSQIECLTAVEYDSTIKESLELVWNKLIKKL